MIEELIIQKSYWVFKFFVMFIKLMLPNNDEYTVLCPFTLTPPPKKNPCNESILVLSEVLDGENYHSKLNFCSKFKEKKTSFINLKNFMMCILRNKESFFYIVL